MPFGISLLAAILLAVFFHPPGEDAPNDRRSGSPTISKGLRTGRRRPSSTRSPNWSAWPIGWASLRLVRRAPRPRARGAPAHPPALRPPSGGTDPVDPPGDGDHLPQPASPAGRRRAGGGGGCADRGADRPFGFGSGSTPEEAGLFGADLTDDADAPGPVRRGVAGHPRGLERGLVRGSSAILHRAAPPRAADPRGRSARSLLGRRQQRRARPGSPVACISICCSPTCARPSNTGSTRAAYREAGGSGTDRRQPARYSSAPTTTPHSRSPSRRSGPSGDDSAQEGKIPADTTEPADPADLCGHPINFIVGGPEAVARQLLELHAQSPFDVANVEVRWAGLSHEQTLESVRRLMEDVAPLLGRLARAGQVRDGER